MEVRPRRQTPPLDLPKLSFGGEGNEEEADPVQARAHALACAEIAHSACHADTEKFCQDVQARVFASQRTIFLLDAPTSKLHVLVQMLKVVLRLNLRRLVVLVPAGELSSSPMCSECGDGRGMPEQ